MNHSTLHRSGNLPIIALMFLFCSWLVSCGQQESDQNARQNNREHAEKPCTKCIDNKPDTTEFTKILNGLNHSISLEQALNMVNRFEDVREKMIHAGFNKNTLPVYETFNLKAIDELICQPDAVGFRIYMSMDEKNEVRFVLIGVDSEGNDIIQQNRDTTQSKSGVRNGGPGIIIEVGQRYP